MFSEVRWTAWSENHVARHAVSPQEVEEALFAQPRWITKGRNDTTLVHGRTDAGRLLLVVTVAEGNGVAFVVTARELEEREKRTFLGKAR